VGDYIVFPVAIPAPGSQLGSPGHLFSMKATFIGFGDIVMAYSAVNDFQVFIMGKILETSQIGVAIDTLEVAMSRF
jgi:hypothetical protein